uniref:acetyl-CoA hydrolase/transferase C-terminal domain-containing protein n=1 Tax=Microbulbifer agarilyticus TaxID=260552 RepID=UPI000255B5D4|nr:acetyl-CoA hydrolase/transferase C-terminal domain-containing protein [Microbulbifer agarilyticus]
MQSTKEPEYFEEVEACVEAVLASTGNRIVLGLPLGIGKANHFANALYARAEADPDISLTIFTALTLERPASGNELQRRFVLPLLDRLYRDYQDLAYNQARRKGLLPPNVEVCEFFMQPGSMLNVASAQQDYVSTNYTLVPRDLLDRGVNVVAQMVSPATDDSGDYSLSSNPDLTLPLLALAERRNHGPITVVGEVNPHLPFIGGDARVSESIFDFLLHGDTFAQEIFPAPNAPVRFTEYALSFHIASLVKDGGTLQVGIGALGDAICHALRLRHTHNQDFNDILHSLQSELDATVCSIPAESGLFSLGIYGASEMVPEGFLHLRRAGVMKRKVYQDAALQSLLNTSSIADCASEELLLALRDSGRIQSPLSEDDTRFLQAMGIIDPSYSWRGHRFLDEGGELEECDLHSTTGRQKLLGSVAGKPIAGGTWLHGGFYLGSTSLYRELRDMDPDELAGINMTGIDYINTLEQDRELKCAQRQHARFVNSAMMVTLNGAVVSDGLANGKVVSGVGGQYNFVAQAQELPGARSIIALSSTRTSGGRAQSNIVWEYPNCTIPRHLRDIVVTEYGIADLRGKTDRDVIVAMLCIADTRFQGELLAKAKAAGKVERSFKIPPQYRNNTPHRILAIFEQGHRPALLPYYPLGTDFTEQEAQLAVALQSLKETGRNVFTYWPLLRKGRDLVKHRLDEFPAIRACLERMGFDGSDDFHHRLLAYLVAGACLTFFDDRRALGDTAASNDANVQ